jgi:hypothetical protein
VVLESRADALGRLLRLLASVYHSRLNVTSGELLYAVCNHDGPSPFLSLLYRFTPFCPSLTHLTES